MADIKISELNSVASLNNGDLVEVSQENALAPSGYTSLKASMTDIGDKVNTDIEYTTDLADFTDKTIAGAIKETAKDKNVADEYDDTQTYDKGDVVIYKNTLYICTTNNTTGTWDASKWTATTVQSLIGDLTNLTTTDKSSIVGAVNSIVKTDTISISKGSAMNTATIACYQIGKLVQFFLVGDASSAFTNSSEIATGLPIPKDTAIRYGIHKTSAGSPYGIGTTYQCGIDSNGKLTPLYIPNGAIGNGDYLFISFCYVAKDLQ